RAVGIGRQRLLIQDIIEVAGDVAVGVDDRGGVAVGIQERACHVAVLYPAPIAFWSEYCRFVIRSADVSCTYNLAKHCRHRATGSAWIPRLLIHLVPRSCRLPVQSRFSGRPATRGRSMVLSQRRRIQCPCRTAQTDTLSPLQRPRHPDSPRLSLRL